MTRTLLEIATGIAYWTLPRCEQVEFENRDLPAAAPTVTIPVSLFNALHGLSELVIKAAEETKPEPR